MNPPGSSSINQPTMTIMTSITATLIAATLSTVVHAQLAQPNIASLVTRIEHPAVTDALRGSVSALAVNEDAWLALDGVQVVRAEGIPLGPNRTVTLLLHRIEPMTADAQIVVANREANGRISEKLIDRPEGQWWTGVVEGEPGSRAMLSRSAAGVLGFVQDSHGTGVIASDAPGRAGPIVSYLMGELPLGTINWTPWICTELSAPDAVQVEFEPRALAVQPCRQLRIAVDTDKQFCARFANADHPTAAATAYTATIYAAMRSIYQADLQILPAVSFLRLWPTGSNDPWVANTLLTALCEFRDHWVANGTSVPRDHAQMLSSRVFGGGIAWTRAACGNNAYSLCGDMTGSFPYPLVNNNANNWDISITSHELGHSVGSTHTHNFCPTPGDTCAPNGLFGQCQTSQTCITTGSIMSYCNQCAGGMANVVLNFHPLSIDAIGTYMTASCNRIAAATAPVSVDDWETAMEGATIDIDPLENDQLVNCEILSLKDFDTESTRGGVVTRVVGAGKGGRDLVRYRAPFDASGIDTFQYRARESSGTVTPPATVAVRITARRIGDINGDGRVNGADLGELLNAWGPGNGLADLNRDGNVNGADLGGLLFGWTG